MCTCSPYIRQEPSRPLPSFIDVDPHASRSAVSTMQLRDKFLPLAGWDISLVVPLVKKTVHAPGELSHILLLFFAEVLPPSSEPLKCRNHQLAGSFSPQIVR